MQTEKYSSGVNTCEYIVLHHTGWTLKLRNQVEFLCNWPKQVSCHYVVWQEWEVVKISDDKKITWHAGESKRKWRTNMNQYSIGIEIVSDGFRYTKNQYHAVNNLVIELMQKHKIHIENVVRHKDISWFRWKRDVSDDFWNKYHTSYSDYKKFLQSNVLLMWFYRNLRKENCETIPVEKRIFKYPAWFMEKTKDLSIEEKFDELVHLIWFLMEKKNAK